MEKSIKNKTGTYLLFFGKSLIWSVLLYATLMLLLNWDDIIAHAKAGPASFTANIHATSTVKTSSGGSFVFAILSSISCNFVR